MMELAVNMVAMELTGKDMVAEDLTGGAWLDVGTVTDIPLRGARVVAFPTGNIAVFRANDGLVFALRDKCPHKGGPLSQGIVHGHAVTCPLHNWVISLIDGTAQGADSGCTPQIPTRIANGRVLLSADAIARLVD